MDRACRRARVLADQLGDFAQHVPRARAAEQRAPQQALAHHAPRGPHVSSVRVSRSFFPNPPRQELLGRAVPPRADVRLAKRNVIAGLGARLRRLAEVCEADRAVRDEDVLGLDVTVRPPVRVAVRQRAEQAPAHAGDRALRQPDLAARLGRLQRLEHVALAPLRDQEHLAPLAPARGAAR